MKDACISFLSLPFSFHSAHLDLTVVQTGNSSRAVTVSMSPLLSFSGKTGLQCTAKVHQYTVRLELFGYGNTHKEDILAHWYV